MSFSSGDLGFFFTGSGGPGDDRELNLGGAISATEIVHSENQNWFPDIPRSVVGPVGSTGTWVVYAPFYVKNKHASISITNVQLTIDHEPSNINLGIQMGFDAAGVNGTMDTISSITDPPTGVTFSDPIVCTSFFFGHCYQWSTTVWNVVSSSNFDPGDYCGLWVKVYGNKGLTSIPSINFQLKCSFVRPAS
jgi:hypothetical protein